MLVKKIPLPPRLFYPVVFVYVRTMGEGGKIILVAFKSSSLSKQCVAALLASCPFG